MQKDYCKPRTGNTVVGEGAITTGSMLLPASQGQNGGGGGLFFCRKKWTWLERSAQGPPLCSASLGRGCMLAQAEGESQFRFRVWWGEKEACWMELTSPLFGGRWI